MTINFRAVVCFTWILVDCMPASRPEFIQEQRHLPAQHSPDFLLLVPLIMREVLARAPRLEPLMVDVQSFVVAARSLPTPQVVDSVAVRTSVAREHLDVSTANAVIRRSGAQFEILHRGLHVSLDSITSTERGYEAFVAYRYTDVRGENTAVGQTDLIIVLARGRHGWQVESTRVLGTS